jgi:hypothetical protein
MLGCSIASFLNFNLPPRISREYLIPHMKDEKNKICLSHCVSNMPSICGVFGSDLSIFLLVDSGNVVYILQALTQ